MLTTPNSLYEYKYKCVCVWVCESVCILLCFKVFNLLSSNYKECQTKINTTMHCASQRYKCILWSKPMRHWKKTHDNNEDDTEICGSLVHYASMYFYFDFDLSVALSEPRRKVSDRYTLAQVAQNCFSSRQCVDKKAA